jgi:Zn finger protein HypA/HybF involved in hydrogenase expression
MHEVSLVQALFDQADRAIAPHSSAAVRRILVRIGSHAGVELELFRTAFAACKPERGYEAAELELLLEPSRWECASCGAEIREGEPLRCAACAGPARLAAGGELILQRLELEVSDV